ncbi:hypothetical protein EBR77_03030 [bacterium]|nr:hypothetical protein [bacterium]
MNKNIMMALLIIVVGPLNAYFNLVDSAIQPKGYTWQAGVYSFKNITANIFTFKYAIGTKQVIGYINSHTRVYSYPPIYNTDTDSNYYDLTKGHNESYLKPVTLSANDTRDNTQTLTMVTNLGKFEISTNVYSKKSKKYITIAKTYPFNAFNNTDTYSIDTKGATIHIYDPSGIEIKPIQ